MEANLYRIWFGTSNDRSELGRAKATDIDQVIEHVKKEYLKPEVEFYDIDYQSEDQVYLMIDLCKDCEYSSCLECDGDIEADMNREDCQQCLEYETTKCEDCEQSEYIEIEKDEYGYEHEMKTIYGTNEYYDLTNPQKTEQTQIYNKFLHQAWKTSQQLGMSALIIQTIKDHPELEHGFAKELIEKSREDTKHLNP